MIQASLRKKLGAASVALAILAGCRAPVANSALQPLQPVTAWAQGKAQVAQSQGGVTLTVAFLDAGVGVWRFQVQVANAGERPVLVTPEAIRCLWNEDPAAGLPDQEVAARDPELLIKALAKEEAEETSRRANQSGIHALFSLVSLADTMANTSKRTVEENRASNQETREIQRDMSSSEKKSEDTSNDLANQRQAVERNWLRRTTLAPGQEVRGQVVVNASGPRARKVRLRIPVEQAAFDFEFGPQ